MSPSVGQRDGVGRIQGCHGPFPFLAAPAGARWFLGRQPLPQLGNEFRIVILRLLRMIST